ncbi:hypothetical protein [Nautilia lithotrophica]
MNVFTKEFECLLNFIGWGDPINGLWTIGIEEGGEWCKNDIKEVKKEIKSKLCQSFIEEEGSNLNWPVANGCAKIGCKLSANCNNWTEYRDNILWKKNSKIFNGNIYPLGRKTIYKNFPKCYEELFGITENNLNTYIETVKTIRFPLIRKLKKQYAPKAIICFGKTYWDEFMEVFELKNKNFKNKEHFKIFENERIILIPHFSRGHMSDENIESLVEILRSWDVKLP